ncbi:MAG: cyclic nucleotide-binding domain-containing protein [Pseudomonadota bacterium]
MDVSAIINGFVTGRLLFKPGDTLFHEGGEAGDVFIVLKGRVRIKKKAPKGMVNLAVLEAGDMLGETSFFDTTALRRATTAVAETEVILGVLDKALLQIELSKISSIQKDILAGLARRIRLTTANAALMAGS